MATKSLTASVKAAPDGEGTFTGYASVFGNVDSYGDVVQKGAFANTLAAWQEKGKTIPVLFGHDFSDPFSNIGGVTSAEEDDHGLKVTGALDLENPKAAQVYRLLKDGRISDMSFAFDVNSSEQGEVDGHKVNLLTDLTLYEVSIVPVGANQEAGVIDVKAVARDIAAKAGRVISAKNENELSGALASLEEATGRIKNVLAALGEDDSQKEAASSGEAKNEEPSQAKSEEPVSADPAELLALQIQIRSRMNGGKE